MTIHWHLMSIVISFDDASPFVVCFHKNDAITLLLCFGTKISIRNKINAQIVSVLLHSINFWKKIAFSIFEKLQFMWCYLHENVIFLSKNVNKTFSNFNIHDSSCKILHACLISIQAIHKHFFNLISLHFSSSSSYSSAFENDIQEFFYFILFIQCWCL